MALDLYQPCPCHQKRKLKFCCGKDVVARIGKAIELMEGEQRRKAMDYLDESIKKFGHKDCLSTMRFGASMDSGDVVSATETADQYLQENGPSSVGCSMQAILSLENDSVDQAIDFLQSGLEADDQIANLFEDALLTLIFRLLAQNDFPAARSHAYLFHHVTHEKQELAESIIKRCQQTNAPLVLKNQWPLVSPTAEKPWAKQVAQAIHWAEKWQWRKSLEAMTELANEYPDQSLLWKNTAILAGHLNKKDVAADAWRRYARCEETQYDSAVEAEQLAIILSSWGDFEKETVFAGRCNVESLDALLEEFEKNPNLYNNQQQVERLQAQNDQSIKACYQVHDRPLVHSASDVNSYTDLPLSLGIVLVGAKTTDKPASLEFFGSNDPRWEEFVKSIDANPSIIKDSFTCEKTQATETPEIVDRMEWSWYTPKDTEEDQRLGWMEEKWFDLLQKEVLPYQTSFLEGNSLQQAATKAELLPRVTAILELLSEDFTADFDKRPGLAKLQSLLNLPELSKIDPETVHLDEISLEQFARLDFEKMPNEMLGWALEVSGVVANYKAIKAIADTISARLEENREEVLATFPVSMIYQVQAKMAAKSSDVQKYLDLAEQYFPEDSSLKQQADWIMSNFEICVSRRLFDRAISLLQQASEVCKQDEELHVEFVKTCARLGIHPNSPMTSMSQETKSRASNLILDPNEKVEQGAPSELWIPGQ